MVYPEGIAAVDLGVIGVVGGAAKPKVAPDSVTSGTWSSGRGISAGPVVEIGAPPDSVTSGTWSSGGGRSAGAVVEIAGPRDVSASVVPVGKVGVAGARPGSGWTQCEWTAEGEAGVWSSGARSGGSTKVQTAGGMRVGVSPSTFAGKHVGSSSESTDGVLSSTSVGLKVADPVADPAGLVGDCDMLRYPFANPNKILNYDLKTIDRVNSEKTLIKLTQTSETHSVSTWKNDMQLWSLCDIPKTWPKGEMAADQAFVQPMPSWCNQILSHSVDNHKEPLQTIPPSWYFPLMEINCSTNSP